MPRVDLLLFVVGAPTMLSAVAMTTLNGNRKRKNRRAGVSYFQVTQQPGGDEESLYTELGNQFRVRERRWRMVAYAIGFTWLLLAILGRATH